MIDPRFANAGAVPLGSGYGAQQVPIHHHRHRQHRPRKSKHGAVGESPLSRDESIHKVDHGHHNFQQNDGAQFGSGYGVPYGAVGYGVVGTGGYYQQQQQQQQQHQHHHHHHQHHQHHQHQQHQQQQHQQQQHQQQQYPVGTYNYGHQQQGASYGQGQYGASSATPMVKHSRRHHRHRHHGAEIANTVVDQNQGIPEQLIGQRSSSVLGDEAPQIHSPIPSADSEVRGEPVIHHQRRRHHRRHHSAEHAGFGQTHQSRHSQGRTSAGPDGYGHINDDLIFIERGEHSPHRQEPPPGYEYKGKIEVQGIEKEYRSRSQGQGSVLSPAPLPVPMTQPVPPPGSLSACPAGWQQIILTAAPGGPCPPGAAMYAGQVIGAAGVGQAGLGGIPGLGGPAGGIGFGGVGPMGATGSGGGLANLAASLPLPPQGQLVADYIVEAGGGSSGGSGYPNDYQQSGGGSFGEHQEHTEENVSGRATIIEVWQKRTKSEGHEKTRSRSRSRSKSPKTGSSHDFERFRNDILGAIERIIQTGGTGAKIQWTGHDGGTQTQINPSTGYDDKKETERRPTSSGTGEVRVIVQPIQPVFYMPRQGETATATGAPQIGPSVGPAPAIQQTASGAPNVVYIPRNVYVPVIKPVFVPRERVIVRPQVIHVARPVLVDRPVPVTQRPIIIDRERPVPVPVRGAGQGVTQAGGSKTVKEEFVYRDNLPVAYGGRCAEFAGGANYGYTPTQQEQEYSANSVHEASSAYQTQETATNLSDQFQHSQSAAQLNLQQGGSGSFHGSYTNLARTNSASAVDGQPLHCTAPMEVLDATINPSWQRTDKTTLVRRYGRPAYDIVERTDQVEQQMYQELRQRNSINGSQRPASAASYTSASGGVAGHGGGYAAHHGSFSSIPLGDMKILNPEGIPHQGPAPVPVTINY